MTLNLGNHMTIINGQFVNAEVERVVQAIKQYEPLIDVEWLPVGARINENGDPLPAFKIIYRDPTGPDFILFHVKDESEFNMSVLTRIIHNDQRNGAVQFSELEAFEEAQRLIKEQEFQDWLEEQADIVGHIAKSHLNTYKVSDSLTIKEGIPFNANRLKD